MLGLLLPWLGRAEGEGTPYLVGFAQDDLSNDWRAAQVRALEQAFRDDPDIRFVYTDARGSTARQIQDIEQLAARGLDVLITSPRDTRAMTPVIREVHRNGTPVVLLTRRITTGDFTVFIHPDDCGIGRRAARLLARHLDGR
ncbi:MAG TPA: substrate-binding domain-containing protein, partial [Gammaproteobacteria bacterium]|nr:substrate-binding domain-containing protein [Gammaproteobacteria bacterium]